MLRLWIFCYLCLSLPYCHVWFLQPCGHLLGRAILLALLYVMFSCVFITFPYGVLGQVWFLSISIPDICFRQPVSRRILANFLINKYTKLRCHMASMSMNDRPLVNQIMPIGFLAVLGFCFRVLMEYFFQTTAPLLVVVSAGTKKTSSGILGCPFKMSKSERRWN